MALIINDSAFNSNWTNQGSGESWTLGATSLSVLLDISVSKRARRDVTLQSGLTYRINLNFVITGSGDTNIKLFLDGLKEINLGDFPPSITYNHPVYLTLEYSYTFIEIQADTRGEDVTITSFTNIYIESVNVKKWLTKLDSPKLYDGYPFLLSAAIGDIDDQLILVITAYSFDGAPIVTNLTDPESVQNSVIHYDIRQIGGLFGESVSYLTVYIKNSLGNLLTEVKTIKVIQPCDNPVYLLARNSLGGALQWFFDINQEYTFDYGNDIKAKRLVLSTQNLTINEWESLQDFIRLGQVYRENITELTSSTIKTSSRTGQQVYIVDDEGNKTGVLVLPIKNTTFTKQRKHFFELEIEYPEEFTV